VNAAKPQAAQSANDLSFPLKRPVRPLLTLFVMLIAAAPFLALQITFNLGVTGHAFQSPYGYYLEQDQPGSSFGFHTYDPAAHPQSTLPEKLDNYGLWVRP
jgi:hypothetical protein